MKPSLFWATTVAGLLSCTVLATAQTQSATPPAATGTTMAPAGMAAGASSAHGALSAQDKMFVKKAAQAGLAEVQAAQLAQTKGTSDQVKQFAQRMITDHTKVNQQLTQTATTLGETPPTEPSPAQQKEAARLQGLSGAAFDRAYAKQQIMAHQQVLKDLQNEASNGTNPQLKTFAQQTIPAVQEHLQMAQQLTTSSKGQM